MSERLSAPASQWKVRLSDEGRTAHPYCTEVWGDGFHNHPAVDLVKHPEMICLLPEIKEFPALGRLLVAANVMNKRLRTTACSPGAIACIPKRCNGFTRAAGALIHVALRDDPMNKQRQNLVDFAHALVQAIEWTEMPDLWVTLTVEPYKSWHGMTGFYGLAFEFSACAHDDDAAWKKARAYAHRLATAIARA